MNRRRHFIKKVIGLVGVMGGICSPLTALFSSVFAAVGKRILPKGTDPSSLLDLNPADVDTSHLEVMPVDAFRTMGDTDMLVDIIKWRLEIGGIVYHTASLSYDHILEMPSIERNVLRICPGIFSNNGRWKGVSGKAVLEMVSARAGVNRIAVHGLSHSGDHEVIFPIGDFASDRVFLCYGLNGRVLPEKHGYPLRIVAEGHFGAEWAKYVNRIEFVGDDYEKQNMDAGGGA